MERVLLFLAVLGLVILTRWISGYLSENILDAWRENRDKKKGEKWELSFSHKITYIILFIIVPIIAFLCLVTSN